MVSGMEPLTDTTSFKEKLEAMHTFPGPFMFKVIGENTDDFHDRAVAALRAVAPTSELEVTRRESKGARHQSLTMVLQVDSSQAVVDIYARLSELPGIEYML